MYLIQMRRSFASLKMTFLILCIEIPGRHTSSERSFPEIL